MADQPKKPRNIKDLKARLGRTISPQQQQQQGGQGQGGAVPPPNVAQQGPAAPAPQQGGPVPPPGGGGSTAPPPPGVPAAPAGAPGGDVAPPPFVQQQQQQQQQARQSADPFAASSGAAAGQQQGEVRLVVDEKPVADDEVGRKKRGMTYILMGAGVLIGLGVGTAFGHSAYHGKLYNLAIQDGRELYAKVKDSSETVDQANKYVKSAVKASKGDTGEGPRVDYQALKKLRQLEKPFEPADLADKRFKALKKSSNDLFEYVNTVDQLWTKIQALAGSALPEDRRKRLDEAAKAAGETTSQQTGCVPDIVEKQWTCGLVYVHPPAEEPEEPVTELDVSTSKKGRTFKKTIYAGQDDFTENPSDYVILTNTKRSLGVLGESASLFAEYQRDLLQVKKQLDKARKLQGKLKSTLGEVAGLEEHFFAF